MLKILLFSLLSPQSYTASKTCHSKDMVVRFEGERAIYVSGKGHKFKVENPKKEVYANKTTYLGKAEYNKSYGHRTLRLSVKKNGSADFSLQMANRRALELKLSCY